jgi:hypothetical protein
MVEGGVHAPVITDQFELGEQRGAGVTAILDHWLLTHRTGDVC